ncbi:MAG: hypothetical protein Q9183_006722, partial [Haloplaca sp. 2 TL-2023]
MDPRASIAGEEEVVTTTTYIGIATNVEGQAETFTVPALVEGTGTVFGKPVMGEATPVPTSVVMLPWPNLPVGWFSSSQYTESGVTGAISAPVVPTGVPVVVEEAGSEGTQASESGGEGSEGSDAGSQETKQDSGDDGDGGGTVLDTNANDATQSGAGSSFSLM